MIEILFRNWLGTRKMCMESPAGNINGISEREHLALREILEKNPGYTWEPVRQGYAEANRLPLVPSYQWREGN